MMKKMLALSLLTVAILLAGCGQSQSHSGQSPKDVLSAYFDAMKAGDWASAYALISAKDQPVKTLAEFKADHRVTDNEVKAVFTRAFRKRTSFRILSVETNGDRAKARVEVTLPNVKAMFLAVAGPAMASAFGRDEALPSSEAIAQAVAKKLQSGDIPTVKTKRDYVLTHGKKGWRVFLDWAGHKAKALVEEADQLREEEDLIAAREKYQAALEINPSLEVAETGLSEVKSRLAYRKKIDLYNVTVGYQETWPGEHAASVEFELRNSGNRTVTKVEVTVYLLNASGQPIHEEKYYPIQAAGLFSVDSPLRPGYMSKAGTLLSPPSEWQKGAAKIQVTGVTFAQPEAHAGAPPSEAVEAYVKHVKLYDLTAGYYDIHPDEQGAVAGVAFKLRNTGERTLGDVEVTVYFLNASGRAIHEKKLHPLSMTNILGDDPPLRPGYIWHLETMDFLPAMSVPSTWKEGAVRVKVTGVEFAENAE